MYKQNGFLSCIGKGDVIRFLEHPRVCKKTIRKGEIVMDQNVPTDSDIALGKFLFNKWNSRIKELNDMIPKVHNKLGDAELNARIEHEKMLLKTAQEYAKNAADTYHSYNKFFGKQKAWQTYQAAQNDVSSKQNNIKNLMKQRDKLYDSVTNLKDEDIKALIIETLNSNFSYGLYTQITVKSALYYHPYFSRGFSHLKRPLSAYFEEQLMRCVSDLEKEGIVFIYTYESPVAVKYSGRWDYVNRTQRQLRLNRIMSTKFILNYVSTNLIDSLIINRIIHEIGNGEREISELERVICQSNYMPPDLVRKCTEKALTRGLVVKKEYVQTTCAEFQKEVKKSVFRLSIGKSPQESELLTNMQQDNTNSPLGVDAADRMDGHQFEQYVGTILGKNGFKNIRVTKGSGDQGVDIIATKDEIKYAIQCKCYSSDVGNTAVQEVYAGKNLYGCHVAVVLTNRHFTAGAKQLAQTTGVLLWDREKLSELIKNAQS